MHELSEGVRLKRIFGPTDVTGDAVNFSLGYNCNEIVVVMQQGQSAMVPWARVVRSDGAVFLLNLALMETVEIATAEKSEAA